MGERWNRWKNRFGTATVLVGMFLVGGLVWWNMCGQGPYKDSCRVSLGCRSFLCLEHGLRGEQQVPAAGRCTKPCSKDEECGDGFRCVTLGGGARDDLPPFGKPDRACMRVLE
jgi:hypothetical protein